MKLKDLNSLDLTKIFRRFSLMLGYLFLTKMLGASITLLRNMDLEELLKNSRGSMPDFNQDVTDLTGMTKLLIFYMLNKANQ